MFAAALSAAIFAFMVKKPDNWIKTSISISLNVFLGMGVFGLLVGEMVMSVLSFILFSVFGIYMVSAWKRIPYISSNFSTAIHVIKSNRGMSTAAVILQLVSIGWTIVWLIACTGAIHLVGPGIIVVFAISYFWVQQVLKVCSTESTFAKLYFNALVLKLYIVFYQNMMHVTAAGVVGRWWHTATRDPNFTESEVLVS